MKMHLLKLCVAGIAVFLISGCSRDSEKVSGPAAVDSLDIVRQSFAAPENCRPCHPNHVAEWETSMHAYAMTDPVFLELNNIGQQRSQNELDQFCVKCHSPIGSMLGETGPGFEFSELTELAQNAVQCDVCHLMKTSARGKGISAFRMDRVRQGSIPDPKVNAYHESEFDARYTSSALCAPCHDIISPTGVLVEATSTEWDESPYSAMGLECQNCHMPEYDGKAATGGEQRKVHRHYFTGVDVALTDFPGRDETVNRVRELLQNAVQMSIDVPASSGMNDPLVVKVSLNNNRTGHRIPSGSTFERQMWIEVVVSQNGQALFESGTLDSNGDLRNSHSELVSSGVAMEDTALALYRGIAMKNNEEIPFFWEADEVQFNTIEPFQIVMNNYRIDGPFLTGNLTLSVRLRFRAFPPYILRQLGLSHLVQELPVFDMAEYSSTITIN